MKTLLLALLGASLQGSHEPVAARSPLPTIGERALDVKVSERWQLRVLSVDMHIEQSDVYWGYGVANSSIRVEKEARFQVHDAAILEARARTITRSYSEVSSKVDSSIDFTIPEYRERYCERGAVHGESEYSRSTLRYGWNADLGEYEVTRETKGGSLQLLEPVPEADDGSRAFVSAPIDLPRLVQHWRASDPPVTRSSVDWDSRFPLALSAVIDALPRLEALQGELTENDRIGTDTVREYELLLQTGPDVDVSRQIVERMRAHPESADRMGVKFDTARVDATLRGSVRVTRKPEERFPDSIGVEANVVLELDLSGPTFMGGRARLHYSLEGTLEREFSARTE